MLHQSLCLLAALSLGADWPTYQGDVARSGISQQSLPPSLTEAWRHDSSPPRPAWPEPARQDFWHNKYGLTPSITFDRVHEVVAADGRVYFGSTAEDTVTCLDAETGRSLWVFYAEGPVRLAPSVVDGRVYFGSDDGHAYCLAADTGSLVWKHRIADEDRRIGGNGRMISAWPLRCGTLVDSGTVFCTAGIFPQYGVWLAALDAADGTVRWRQRLEEIAPQGHLLASPTRLYVPTGRTSPAIFDRHNGNVVDLSGTSRRGGTFALIVDDGLVHRGVGEGQIELQTGSGDRLALFAGRQVIVDGNTTYLLGEQKLSALNRAEYVRLAQERQTLSKAEETDDVRRQLHEIARALEACCLWKIETKQHDAILLTKESILVGGENELAVRNRTDGSLLTTLPVDGAACGLAIADGRVLVSTDRGVLHCFASGESREAVETTESATIAEETSEQEDADPLHLVAGPHVRHLAPDSVEISWQVGDIRSMSVQILEAGSAIQELAAQTTLWGDDPASHSVAATGLKLSSEYAFRITATDPDGSLSETQAFTLDAACDVPARPAPQGEPVTKTADLVAGLPHVDENTVGYALLLGDDATLAIELARQTMLQSIVVEPDVAKAAATRTKLADAGIHGTRAVVHCAPLNQLPYASRSINLIVVQPSRCGIEWSSDVGVEMARVCRPSGAVCFPKTEDLQGAEEHLKSGTRLTWYGGGWCRLGWRKLEQRGQWSHLYCDPSGKASSSETLRAPLQIQWFGRPGPKHMIDRHHRGMSPLVVDGRIFLPGNERLKGVDAYNGTILWDLTMPGFRRVAMMRDSGHLAAQENEVFAVIRNGCRVIDAASGRWLRTLALPESENACPKYWGYLAVIDDAVLGTAEIAGASYDQHEREIPARVSYWDNVPVVTGKTLFSLDRKTGKPRWIYRNPEGSVLLHSTIVADNGCVFFVESRAPEAIADSDGRVTLEMACVSGASWLVALDLASGKELWEHLVELPEIRNVLHAVCAEDTVVLAGTQNEERHPRYDLLAFNASNGSPRWATHYLLTDKEPNGDHGEQDQHPVVIGRTLYTRPWAFDVLTGEKLDFQLDRGGHGCGGLSGSACYLFGRGRNPRIYDLDPGVQSGMPVTQVTRPGCWINMIAADGLLLIPEGSSGCSCAFSIQTSLGLAPIQER